MKSTQRIQRENKYNLFGGKGLITTTQITHASPAGVYAHTANRNWESNQQLLDDGGNPNYCSDIAQQLVRGSVGRKLKVSCLQHSFVEHVSTKFRVLINYDEPRPSSHSDSNNSLTLCIYFCSDALRNVAKYLSIADPFFASFHSFDALLFLFFLSRLSWAEVDKNF